MSQSLRLSADAQIENTIRSAVDSVVQQMASRDDEIANMVVGRNRVTSLVINSSFLYRERQSVKINQSSRRLVAQLSATGKRVAANEIFIVDGLALKVHYKPLSPKEAMGLIPLSEAVADELASLGDLIFILIGTMRGLRPSVQAVEATVVRELRLLPSLSGSDVQKLDTGVYAIKKIVPPEELLGLISSDFKDYGGLSIADRRAIAEAYDSMTDAATTDVTVPSGRIQEPQETILGKIVASLRRQTDEYRNALKRLDDGPDDSTPLNEVLRIAYNFSSDVLPLISLFRSICDLKPLVFWCTIKEQWALYRAFASLPWSALGRKEKLEEYQAIVSQARSYAFHHVLPFDSTVEIDLSNLDVRADKIRLFLPFKEKQGRGVHIKDQKLADVLSEFSRAKLRPVSIAFWQANLKVMEQSCQLAQHILESLVLIHQAKKP
jgi:hypothetical protein